MQVHGQARSQKVTVGGENLSKGGIALPVVVVWRTVADLDGGIEQLGESPLPLLATDLHTVTNWVWDVRIGEFTNRLTDI